MTNSANTVTQYAYTGTVTADVGALGVKTSNNGSVKYSSEQKGLLVIEFPIPGESKCAISLGTPHHEIDNGLVFEGGFLAIGGTECPTSESSYLFFAKALCLDTAVVAGGRITTIKGSASETGVYTGTKGTISVDISIVSPR